MSPLQIILGIVLFLAAIFLVIVVMLQDKAKRGLSGAIAGGSNENSFAKNGASDKGKKLSKATTVVAIVFVVVVVIAYLFT